MKYRSNDSRQFYKARYYFLSFVLFTCVCGLFWRMVDLTVLDRDFLQGQGDARTLRMVESPAYRGMITDRNGAPLAISTPVSSVWVNPQDFPLDDPDVAKLAKLVKLTPKAITHKISKSKSKEFIYLQRGLNPAVGAKVKALGIHGLYLQQEFRRYYPEGEVTAQLLGFTNIDDRGQEGFELAYNNWLQGVPGKKRVLKDRLGHIIADVANIREPRPGHNLTLSIDRRIQYLAYRELKSAMSDYHAKSGSIVVLDSKTGEVLAMVNQPSYNPNLKHKGRDARYRNRAMTDVFEPGSVIKAFTVASAMDSKKFKPDTVINTSPGWMVVDGNTIKDEHDNGDLDVTQILQRSSNVGVTKMTLSNPPEQLWGMLRRVGFGSRSQTGFPGESAGSLENHSVWRQFVLATLGFGYGMSVTPLQLTHAYSVFAANGKLLPLSLLKQDNVPTGKAVLEPYVAQQMLQMLTAVVDRKGTGHRAKIPGYSVAGKTGTARIAGVNGYEANHHVSSFVGIAPAKQPRLVVAVVINDPSGRHYYGGSTAAPVFAKVMAGALRVMDVNPDELMNNDTHS